MEQKKAILVIGGAAGIGKDYVKNRAARGDSVIFTDLNKEAGESLVNELALKGKEATFFSMM